MTAHKHFKQRIRARMEKTGERYAAARRYVLTTIDGDTLPSPVHFPGTVPATTAMRVLLTRAGVRAPHTGRPFSEAMLFGIAGGIGIGVASFVYQTADVATLYLAGRHLWWDDAAYLRAGLERFGIAPAILETGSSRLADENLRAMLDQYGACIAWVDLAELPHRAMPAEWSGGGYHVITVYTIDDTTHTAMIGDLTDEPCSITLGELAKARARNQETTPSLTRCSAGGDDTRATGIGARRSVGVPCGARTPLLAGAGHGPARRAACLGRANGRRHRRGQLGACVSSRPATVAWAQRDV